MPTLTRAVRRLIADKVRQIAMAGLDPRRLALVCAEPADGGKLSVGTGYFLTRDLLLTASHVVPPGQLKSLRLRTEHDGKWREAFGKKKENDQSRRSVEGQEQSLVRWRNVQLDAVLICCQEPVEPEGELEWELERFDADTEWHSTSYPVAGMRDDGETLWKTTGLSGRLYAFGGGGQGARMLELGVDDPPAAEDWAAASGAPVFVEDRLVGLIKQVPLDFSGRRLDGIPAASLWQDHAFRLALAPQWQTINVLPSPTWVLVIRNEGTGNRLDEWVSTTLTEQREKIEAALNHRAVAREPVSLSIGEALRSPEAWLQFVKALCAAPIAIFDATGYQPAMMLALGVRAVVRRGITITTSSEKMAADDFATLPFNIRETKLLYVGEAYGMDESRDPVKNLSDAIVQGWRELQEQPRYMDLPAYEGVRCPYPGSDAQGAVDRILVLCPFNSAYEDTWTMLSNELRLASATRGRRPARMLDMASPRLVGQALYESIRWARTCIVDWTGWRANVFFEFGVRLACADIGPIGLINQQDPTADDVDLEQKKRLLELFRPTRYEVSEHKERRAANSQALRLALADHDATARHEPPPVPIAALPHDATFRVCQDNFEWTRDRLTSEPHTALRSSVEEPFGPDPQAVGRNPILFAANVDYSAGLARSIRERWVAAWYYLANRYPREQWASDSRLRAELRKLANDVMQSGATKNETDPQLQQLRKELLAALRTLRQLDTDAPVETKP